MLAQVCPAKVAPSELELTREDVITISLPGIAAPGQGSAAPMPSELRGRPLRTICMVLAGWSTLWAAAAAWQGMYSWHYFVTGAKVVGSPGWVHVFSTHPELQMGPLTLIAALGVVWGGGVVATLVASALMLALGALVLVMVLAMQRVGSATRRATRLLVVGALLAPAWTLLAVHYGHLDDVLALVAVVGAMLALARSRPWVATLLLAAAVGFKPWAAPIAVVLLAGHRGVRLLSLFAVLVAAPWAVFVIGDPSTLHVGSFAINVAPDSALRVFGVSADTTPVWDRPLQLVLSVVIATGVMRRGLVCAVPFVVLSTRMLLDPGTYPYYTTGLLVAALVLDVGLNGHRLIPRYTVGVTAWLIAVTVLNLASLPAVAGLLRAAYLVTALTMVAVSAGGTGGTGGTHPAPSRPFASAAARRGQP